MELNEIRPFLLPAMDNLAAMRRLKVDERIPNTATADSSANFTASN